MKEADLNRGHELTKFTWRMAGKTEGKKKNAEYIYETRKHMSLAHITGAGCCCYWCFDIVWSVWLYYSSKSTLLSPAITAELIKMSFGILMQGTMH